MAPADSRIDRATTIWFRCGGAALLGLAAAISVSRSGVLSWPPASVALCLGLLGAGLSALAQGWIGFSRLCAWVAGVAALTVLSWHLIHAAASPGELMARGEFPGDMPGAMGASSALSFTVAATALLAMTTERAWPRLVAVAGGFLMGVVLLIVLGYVSGFRPASNWDRFTGITPAAAPGILVLGAACLVWARRKGRRLSTAIPMAAAAAVILASAGVISLRSNDEMVGANQWVTHTFEVRGALEQVLVDLNAADEARRFYNMAAEGKFAIRFQDAAEQTRQDVRGAVRLMADNPSQREIADRLVALVGARLDYNAAGIAERRRRVTTTAERMAKTTQAAAMTLPVQKIISDILAIEKGLLITRTMKAAQAARETRNLLILRTYVALALVSGALAMTIVTERARRRTEAHLFRANEKLRSAHAAAEESTRLKAQFLANMSHEIRTPMNGVVGMIGLLLDSNLTGEQRMLANTVRSSADVLLAILNDILDFSKIEAGQLIFDSVAFDLRDPVEDCLGLLAEKAQAKGLELSCLVEENVPSRVIGDARRLQQVLLNLVGNAVKFTDSGEISVRVSALSANERAATLRFTVRDTGIGIPPEAQGRLFQPFAQADGTTTRNFGGTGLGLAICRQIVHLMGGEIGLESTPGRGSTFWFSAGFSLEVPSPSAGPPPGLAGARALLVEDHATSREFLTRRLKAWAMQVRSAAGGAEAEAMIRAAAAAGAPFDVAVVDLELPGTSGFELARLIAEGTLPSSPALVLLASLGNRAARRDRGILGTHACLAKPPRQLQLAAALSGALTGEPAAPSEPGPLPAPAAPPPVVESRLRILVAEDNPVNQQVAVLQLQKLGHRADVVADGQKAMAAVREKAYDLILMDCQMPVVDGYEATRRIREWEEGRRSDGEAVSPLYIVAMTANALLGDRNTCLEAGMNDYIPKPVLAADLARSLARLQAAAG